MANVREQISSDEPAELLLGRIRKTKTRLISERVIKKQDTDPIREEEIPFSAPASWTWTRLGEIGDWGSGSTPARGNLDLYGGGFTWLKSGELNDNQALTGSEETVSELALKTGSFRKNQPGDVLLAMYGATIGKVAILAEPAVTNQAVCGCTPFEGINNRYLFYYLLSQRPNFHLASEGGAQPNISKVKIVGFLFLLPPLAEQKRIVVKVDELMAQCDRLEAQLKARDEKHAVLARAALARFAELPTTANLELLFHDSYTITPDDLRKAILELAIRGCLVPQHTSDGSTQNYLETPTSLSRRNLPILPTQWTWVRVNETGRVDLGRQRAPQHHHGPNMRPYLRVQNVYEARIDISDVKSMNFTSAEFETFALKIGDILLNEGQSYKLVGRPAIYRGEVPGACFQNTLVRYRCGKHVCADYALAVFRAYLRNGKFQQISKQTTNIAHLSAGRFAVMEFPLPPLAEQRRIVKRVDELMTLVDRLETQLTASRATAEKLLSALVAEIILK